jgi:hypothetical protein
MMNTVNGLAFLTLAVLLGISASCRGPVPSGPPITDAIRKATMVQFGELTAAERSDVGESFGFTETGGWMAGDVKSMPTKNAYFVRTQINASALAFWTFLYSCTGFSSKYCSADELSRLTQEALDVARPYQLYGKYRNRWEFHSAGQIFPRQ